MNTCIAFVIASVAIAGLLLFCWIMEMRTVQNLRDGHQERMMKLQNEHAQTLATLLPRERALGWNEGREYQISITKQKRDAHGRFAREESKT